MTATQGLHIRKDGTTGTTPVDARLAMAGLVAATGGFGGRPGVLSGCAVSGTTGWAYSVAAGHLVTSRSAGDGVVLWSVSSATSVPTSAAPASGSRIDIIYAMHNDVDNGDSDNLPVIDVVQGTAAANPSAPSIPAGAIELGRCTLPSSATTTQGGTFDDTSAQYTAARGAPIPVTGQAQLDALAPAASLIGPVTAVRRDTGVVLHNAGSGWVTVADAGGWTAYTPTVAGWDLGDGTLDCAYRQIGRTVHVRIRLRVGATTSWPGGGLTLTAPVAPRAGLRQYGGGVAVDSSASDRYPLTIEVSPDGTLIPLYNSGSKGAALTLASAPFAWAVADSVYGNATYEAATA